MYKANQAWEASAPTSFSPPGEGLFPNSPSNKPQAGPEPGARRGAVGKILAYPPAPLEHLAQGRSHLRRRWVVLEIVVNSLHKFLRRRHHIALRMEAFLGVIAKLGELRYVGRGQAKEPMEPLRLRLRVTEGLLNLGHGKPGPRGQLHLRRGNLHE